MAFARGRPARGYDRKTDDVVSHAAKLVNFQSSGVRPCDTAADAIAGASGQKLMARITAGVASSHIPALGVASDLGKTGDNAFLDRLEGSTDALRPHIEYLREAGSEGAKLVMWLIMRGALGPTTRTLHRHYHVPASNTAVGHIVLELVA